MVKYILENKDDKEKTLKLYFEKFGSDVMLKGIDNKGKDWNIIRLDRDGTFYRYGDIKEGTGLQLDKEGKIKEE